MLIQEFTNLLSFSLIFDSRKKFRAEPADCFRLVKRHLVIDLASLKMAGLTSGLKDWFDLGFEVRLRGS
jgi:hypothetical protein